MNQATTLISNRTFLLPFFPLNLKLKILSKLRLFRHGDCNAAVENVGSAMYRNWWHVAQDDGVSLAVRQFTGTNFKVAPNSFHKSDHTNWHGLQKNL